MSTWLISPVDPTKAFQQCGYEAYFVNDSNYYLFFNYMNRTNNSWVKPLQRDYRAEYEKYS